MRDMETTAVLAAATAARGARSLIRTGGIAQGRVCSRYTASCRFGSASASRGPQLIRAARVPGGGAVARSLKGESLYPLRSLRQRSSWSWRTMTTNASAEENVDTKVEELTDELEKEAEGSKAAYGEAVDALKEQTIKLQASGKGACEPTAEKAIEVLRDTTEKLKEEAGKAKVLLTATAIETAELGKSNLNLLAENAPDPIKGIAESAVNAHLKDTTRQGARIHDFCLGIPYGAFLVTGGLLWFIITGSTAAIRFGVFLGGLLLFMSVKSLKLWKEGKPSILYIQGQAAIALILFVKDARRFVKTGAIFPPAVSALASGAILAFYIYLYLAGGNPHKKEKKSALSSAA